jgi:hypothetical protein
MKKLIALLAAVSFLGGTAALAAPPSKAKKPAKTTKKTVKIVDLWTCPITGEAIKDHKGTGTPVVVGNKRVHFCCAGCPEQFAKLSAKEKQAKVNEIAKKEAATKSKS